MNTFVPQSSVVGMLLGHEEKYTIIHSTESGIMQHDIYSWELLCDKFTYLEKVNNSSMFIDFTLKHWLAGMDNRQREQFVDTVYAVMQDTNAKTLRDISDNASKQCSARLKIWMRIPANPFRMHFVCFCAVQRSDLHR
mgnify:CR=1 FL=1